ncbi:histidine kinase N-terminal 7TM domain-containing protein [Neotabrizicola sp. VNH66]|uniref:histidine kinase N-terminal 7TM domain-containing protein n=1 Tax=Neotabrizicola sp. VNH66 TaxID=3400918 RepID=UPI003C0CB4FD
MLKCIEVSRIDALGGVTLFFWFAIVFLLYRSAQEYFFGRRYFVVTLMAMLGWLVAVFLEISAITPTCKIIWAQAAWPFIVALPTAWAFFLTDYAAGSAGQGRRWRIVPLIVGPVAAAVVAATNSRHQMFYGPDTGPVVVDGRLVVSFDHGPLFYAFAAYIYIFLIWAVVVALIGSLKASAQHRTFFIGLLLVTLVPGLSNVLYIGFGVTFEGFDPTPFAFSVALFILSLMIAQNRLMDVGSVAKDLLFHNSPDPIIVLDAEGRQIGANPEARRLFGPEVDLTQGVDDQHLKMRDFFDEIIQTGGQPARRTLTARRRYFEPDVFPVRSVYGTNRDVIGWVLRLQDSTERRFLSSALQAERDFLSQLMETSLSGIIALDAEGAIMFINAEAERLLGLQGIPVREVNLSDPDWAFEWPEGVPATGLGHVFARLLEDSRPIRNRRLALRRRSDRERRIISCNASLLQSADGEARVVVSLTDVTDQHRTENNLRDAVAKSESESRSKSQFLANMSHEIRTPLNGVLGMAEVLDRLVHDPEQKKMLTTIRHSGELLLTILNDVLDMSKIEAGKLELEAALFRPDHLAARIYDLYIVSAEEKQLELDVFTSGRAEVQRIGDPHRVMQILQNLVSNAIKFTHSGEIAVSFSCPVGKPMVIEVRDSGIGMTEEQLGRIFNAFEQADGSVTRRFGGTGLGMSIVSKLVEIMGGHVTVESRLGEGTAIRVTLPLEEA